MNATIRNLFRATEGRYLSDAEAQDLGAYADGVLTNVDTMQAIERAEKQILDDVVAAVMAQHATLATDYGPASDQRVRRDQALVLRYAAFAMIMQDPDFIYDKLAVWLRTILFSLCKPEQVMCGFYALADACKRHLSLEDSQAIVPYVEIVIEELENNGGKPS